MEDDPEKIYAAEGDGAAPYQGYMAYKVIGAESLCGGFQMQAAMYQ